MGFLYIFAKPLAFLTRIIYNFVENYGATLIIVTVLIRLLTLPLTVMSQKSSIKTQQIQPEMQKLQQKYKNDKDKLAMEMQKLYKKHDVNPMGGCLPLLVQMFVLFGFIRVVYDPLTHFLQLTTEQIDKIKDALGVSGNVYQVTLCGMEGAAEKIKEFAGRTVNFDFFGIDLTKMLKGNETDILMWVFPVLAVLATILSSYISKKQMAQNSSPANEQAQSMSDSMMTIMPIMTGFFTYTMPAGMSLYWFVSTAVQIIQQTVITKVIEKKIKENIASERKGKK